MSGLFETIGAHDGRLLLWELHTERFCAGARKLGIEMPSLQGLRRRGEQELAHNGDDVLRMALLPAPSGGPARISLTTRRRVARSSPLGLHVAGDRRDGSHRDCDLKLEDRSFLDHAQDEAVAAGADEALLLDGEGRVLETWGHNVFFLRESRWCTPGENGLLLPGIARRLLIEEVQASIGDWRLEDLKASPAIFVTNAVYGARPAYLTSEQQGANGTSLATAWESILARLM
ncbi:MAG: aminotransferase class IV [Planctomycetota bacterium]|nr:aminotransferase class IV [Planctomycetota bacterium]